MEDWTEDDWMEWVEQTYEALDAKDVDAFVAQLTPGATVRFGNGEPVAGRVAIRDAFGEFFDAIDAMSHGFTSQLRVDDTLVIEEIVSFTRRDGTTVVLPAATVCEPATTTISPALSATPGRISHGMLYSGSTTSVTPSARQAARIALVRFWS